MATGKMQARQTKPGLHAWNTFTRWLLHVPLLRRLADSEVCELTFHGVLTGRPVTLPVMYAEQNGCVVVLVGAPDTKVWWHNFATEQPVRVWLRGRERDGRGRTVMPGDLARAAVADIYNAKYPDIPVQDDPLLFITLK